MQLCSTDADSSRIILLKNKKEMATYMLHYTNFVRLSNSLLSKCLSSCSVEFILQKYVTPKNVFYDTSAYISARHIVGRTHASNHNLSSLN